MMYRQCKISSLEIIHARQLRQHQFEKRLLRAYSTSWRLVCGPRVCQRNRFDDTLKASLKKFNIRSTTFKRLSADKPQQKDKSLSKPIDFQRLTQLTLNEKGTFGPNLHFSKLCSPRCAHSDNHQTNSISDNM